MESQLLNCLFADLMGLGKQLFPQAQAGAPGEGQAGAFFDILSQKMGGTMNLLLPSTPAGATVDDGKAEGGKAEDASLCSVAASLDPEEIPVLVSSLISAMGQPVMTDTASDMSEADRERIADFLRGVLEVLSGGDEVELKSAEGAVDKAAGSCGEGEENGNESARDFMECLASVLFQLSGVKTGENDGNPVPAGNGAPSSEEGGNPLEKARQPEPSMMKAEAAQAAVSQDAASAEQEVSAFVVEVVKAANKTPAADPSMKKEMESQPAAPVVEAPEAGKKDTTVLAARAPEAGQDTSEPEKIVIRVRETAQAEVGEDLDSGDNPVIQHNDTSRQNTHETVEAKGIAKNDFGAMMVDKIEKLTEHFAGRSMNMDMTVRLRIDENETVLVGLRDEGSSVTVEVKTTSENTMNFLQSQKDDIGKALEMKNIQTTIHVDIDQDAQGRKQHRQHKDSGEGETPQQQDFDSFFEALA